MRLRPPGKSRRRFGLILGTGAVVIILVVTLRGALGETDSFPLPSQATLTNLSVPQRIVSIAQSQLGYSSEPTNSYCNKFSDYWNAGAPNCPSGEKSEEWCADFAAWAWQKAGVAFTYGYGLGEINGGSRQLLRVGGRQRRVAPGFERICRFARRRGGLRSLAWGGAVGRARGDSHRRRVRAAGTGCGERGWGSDRVLHRRDRD